jgi:hypothetical protein
MDAPAPPATSRESIRAFALLGAFFFVAVAVVYFYTLSWVEPIPRDSTTLVVGRDFLNFWMYGRAAPTPNPSRFYDPVLYNQTLTALLGPDYLGNNWSYPPSVMLVAAPFGQLPYMPGLLIWTALGLGVFVLVLRRQIDDLGVRLALVCSPAAVLCLMSGQSSFLTAAVIVGIFAWLDRKPLLAGFLIGLLTLKPQLGFLFPIMLIASGRWRVFCSAAGTTLAIAAVTAALFGPQVWIDYVAKGIPVQNWVLSDPHLTVAPFMPTIFMNMRTLGASYATASAVQATFSLAAIGTLIWAYRFRRDADPQWLAALFLACSVVASPYLLSYDLVPLTVAGMALLAAGKLDEPGRRLLQAVYWLPVIQIGLGFMHIPGPALIAPAFALYLVARLHAAERPVTTTVSAAA